MDLPKLAEKAYEAHRTSLFTEGRIVPPWEKLTQKDQNAWIKAIETVVNESLWIEHERVLK